MFKYIRKDAKTKHIAGGKVHVFKLCVWVLPTSYPRDNKFASTGEKKGEIFTIAGCSEGSENEGNFRRLRRFLRDVFLVFFACTLPKGRDDDADDEGKKKIGGVRPVENKFFLYTPFIP